MKLIIPNNIFSTLFILAMDEKLRPELEVKEASLISSELDNSETSVGLIPSFDLINNREFFISSKFGIGFESSLSNSYLYFAQGDNDISKILLRGDITTNEVILSKLVFQEQYNLFPEISIDMKEGFEQNSNYLIVGSDNWLNDQYLHGTSFCEQASELIEFPYLNFVFASKSEKAIKEFNAKHNDMKNNILSGLTDNLAKIGLSSEANNFIKSEIDSVYFDLTINELNGLKDLLQLAYFHQIFDDLFEIKVI